VKKPRYVLDSYALLAYLQNEAAAQRVESLLDRAVEGSALIHMSLLNLGEIAYLIERRHGTDQCERTLNALGAFPIAFENVTLDRILAAAHIKARHAISYADAFAAALAQEMDAAIVTGDPEFEQVESFIDIAWLGSTAE
jgi:predicted nucleic acid-binding protein